MLNCMVDAGSSCLKVDTEGLGILISGTSFSAWFSRLPSLHPERLTSSDCGSSLSKLASCGIDLMRREWVKKVRFNGLTYSSMSLKLWASEIVNADAFFPFDFLNLWCVFSVFCIVSHLAFIRAFSSSDMVNWGINQFAFWGWVWWRWAAILYHHMNRWLESHRGHWTRTLVQGDFAVGFAECHNSQRVVSHVTPVTVAWRILDPYWVTPWKLLMWLPRVMYIFSHAKGTYFP